MEIKKIFRTYPCKDEEVAPLCALAVELMTRDLADFQAHSSIYTPEYLTDAMNNIAQVRELVDPQSEVLKRTTITDQLHEVMNSLGRPLDLLSDYLKKTRLSFNMSNFGITHLRAGIRKGDPEAVDEGLNTLIQNITNHKDQFSAVGLTDEFIQNLKDVKTTIFSLKLKQQEISRNRELIVQENIGKINDLYNQMKDILSTGKALYKRTNKVKLAEYTFSNLIKKVRVVSVKKVVKAPNA